VVGFGYRGLVDAGESLSVVSQFERQIQDGSEEAAFVWDCRDRRYFEIFGWVVFNVIPFDNSCVSLGDFFKCFSADAGCSFGALSGDVWSPHDCCCDVFGGPLGAAVDGAAGGGIGHQCVEGWMVLDGDVGFHTWTRNAGILTLDLG